MIKEKGYIRIGYFDNFKGEDTILISVDINGLLVLEELFLKLSNGLSDFHLTNLKSLDVNFHLKINAITSNENIGLRKTISDNYDWINTKQKWSEFREQVTTMISNSKGGHHYLDSNSVDCNELQVVLSWDEYSLVFWEEHKM